jgi:hypothetical protein
VHSILGSWGAADKVVSFVTDWGSNMISAGTGLSGKLTNFLTSVQCVQHLLSNALKDFAKEPSLGKLLEQTKEVVKYITGHNAPKAIYDTKKQQLKGTALIKPATTRFGTNVNTMHSVTKNEYVFTVQHSQYSQGPDREWHEYAVAFFQWHEYAVALAVCHCFVLLPLPCFTAHQPRSRCCYCCCSVALLLPLCVLRWQARAAFNCHQH